MATSKKAAGKPSSSAKPSINVNSTHSHKGLEDKIVALESKVSSLESKLSGLLESIDALSTAKSELQEAKEKLAAEVKELQSNAKSWIQKTSEAMDSNNDGKVDYNEIFLYVKRRLYGRTGR